LTGNADQNSAQSNVAKAQVLQQNVVTQQMDPICPDTLNDAVANRDIEVALRRSIAALRMPRAA
jgi:hypothetical protein